MGTVQGAEHVFQAGSDATGQLVAELRGESNGRQTMVCGSCGRVQYFKGKHVCVACRRLVVIPLAPLGNPDRVLPEASLSFTWRICQKLRILREILGISSASLSSMVGCSTTHIWKYENLMVAPTVAFLARVAAAFDLSLAEILDESIPLQQLALFSMIRSPDKEFIEELLQLLPSLTEHSKARFMETARSLYRCARRRLGMALDQAS